MYAQRDEVLEAKSVAETLEKMYRKVATKLVDKSCDMIDGDAILNAKKLIVNFANLVIGKYYEKEEDYKGLTREEAVEKVYVRLRQGLADNTKEVPAELADVAHRQLLISIIDKNWTRHIDDMSKLKDNTRFRGYAQMNPLNEYINEGFSMFENMMDRIMEEVVTYTSVMQIKFGPAPVRKAEEAEEQPKKPKKITL